MTGLAAVCSALGTFLGSVELRSMAAHHLASLSDTILVLSRALHLVYGFSSICTNYYFKILNIKILNSKLCTQ